jgi:pyrimidine operon attenuation protein / uracil phosphoribosyltransferase
MKLLDAQKIKQKTKRIAIEILENNAKEQQIILAGVNSNGMAFAKMLLEEMAEIKIIQPEIILTKITLNPANPVDQPVTVEMQLENLKDKTVILVDDVANTGRTLQYAMKPLLDVLPKKIELAVLVDRMHKSFPVSPNYVGIALATTLKENIDVQIRDIELNSQAVYLN